MGFLNKMFGGKQEEAVPAIETEKNSIYAPVSGTAITLAEINDGVFSDGVLGQGCGIKPDSETVAAPFHGTVTQVADTKHAVGVLNDDGVEVLIHVGIDTVSMEGKGFTAHVKVGDKVKCGQKLLTFSRRAITEAGFPDTTAIIVTNTDDYEAVTQEKTGVVAVSEKLLFVK